MATPYAIAAVSQTIKGILADARPPEFANAQFELFQFSDFQKPQPMEEGISLYLYRVTVNASQRNLGPYTDLNGQAHGPVLPLDLHYMFTAWARNAVTQQRLLGWCMRILEDTASLSATVLNNYGRPEQAFKNGEAIQLIYDPLSLQDTINLWDVLKPNVQLSVTYTARVIQLESSLEVGVAEPVQTRVFDIGRPAIS